MTEADYQERAVLLALYFTPAVPAPAPDRGDPAPNAKLGALGLLPPQRPPACTEAASRNLGWPGVHWLILNGQKCV